MANKKNKVNLTVEDVKELVMIVAQVHDKGHYASIDFGNHGHNVSIYFKRDGFKAGEEFDFSRDFDLSDRNEDIDAYLEVVDYLLTVLEENDGTPTEL